VDAEEQRALAEAKQREAEEQVSCPLSGACEHRVRTRDVSMCVSCYGDCGCTC